MVNSLASVLRHRKVWFHFFPFLSIHSLSFNSNWQWHMEGNREKKRNLSISINFMWPFDLSSKSQQFLNVDWFNAMNSWMSENNKYLININIKLYHLSLNTFLVPLGYWLMHVPVRDLSFWGDLAAPFNLISI